MDRVLKIRKDDLIAAIQKNKAAHIIDYQEAVVAYKKEAQEQLEKQLKELSEGSLKIAINLVHPVNREKDYDSKIAMFKWEVSEIIEVTEREYRQYVEDEVPESVAARFQNASYKTKFL